MTKIHCPEHGFEMTRDVATQKHFCPIGCEWREEYIDKYPEKFHIVSYK